MTVDPWLMSDHATALSLCLNKPQELKYFAKLEPDPGPTWAPPGHTNHGIRPYLPTNTRQCQNSISKDCILEQKCLCDLPILSERKFGHYHSHRWCEFLSWLRSAPQEKHGLFGKKDSSFGTQRTGYIINI